MQADCNWFNQSFLILFRCAWCATIYFVWKERNARLHGKQQKSELDILEKVKMAQLSGIRSDVINLRNLMLSLNSVFLLRSEVNFLMEGLKLFICC